MSNHAVCSFCIALPAHNGGIAEFGGDLLHNRGHTPEALGARTAMERMNKSLRRLPHCGLPKERPKGGAPSGLVDGILESRGAPRRLTLYSYMRKSSLWASSGRAPSWGSMAYAIWGAICEAYHLTASHHYYLQILLDFLRP